MTDNPTQLENKLEPCADCVVAEHEAWRQFSESHKGSTALRCERHRAPSPSSPVPPEALARASKLCRSTIPGARVELIFQDLQDAQAVHKWLCNLNSPAATPTPVEQERNWWCKRQPWACRYQDARQCAHDTMLGDECPKVCVCACHPALPADTEPVATLSLAAREAAEEIASNYEVHKDRCHSNERYPSPPCDCGAIDEIVAIFSRHCSPVPAAGGDEQPCQCGHDRKSHYKQFGPCTSDGCLKCAQFTESFG